MSTAENGKALLRTNNIDALGTRHPTNWVTIGSLVPLIFTRLSRIRKVLEKVQKLILFSLVFSLVIIIKMD